MIEKTFRRIRDNSWLAYALACLGAALYFVQAWAYAITQTSFMDEGGYLYIGDLYLRGILRPFQDFGPPRWYAPLAYLIPGQIEKWFGASLLTGRFFSVLCGMGMLIPLWLIARRLGGKWWGVAILWSVTLSPISIQIYSLALSQALVVCLLAWSLFFVLAEKRPLWQIVTGSLLSGMVVMTRHNLLPLVPLLVAYVFWQHGRKSGWWAVAGSLLPILVVHALYWPNILQLWAIWLPAKLTPSLDAFRFPAAALQTENTFSLSASLLALLQGFRFHYFSMLGFIVCILLWPRSNEWKSQTNRRGAFFLGILFLILTLLHAWATVSSSNQAITCTFCFTPYLSFFDIIALLLIVIVAPSWRTKIPVSGQIFIIIFVLLFFSGLGYAAYDRFGPWLLGIKFPAFTRGLDPRKWVPFITIWDVLANKYHLDYWNTRVPFSVIAASVFGILFLFFGRLVQKRLSRRESMNAYSYGAFILVALLASGILFSPLMGGTYRQDGICHANIPRTVEQVGKDLARMIPAGSQVYWESENAVPLLYAPGISIYTPQVYELYSFRMGGDPGQLAKFGLWNDELALRWRAEARYIVTDAIWGKGYRPGGDLNTDEFETIQTAPENPCDPSSYLIIYKRKP